MGRDGNQCAGPPSSAIVWYGPVAPHILVSVTHWYAGWQPTLLLPAAASAPSPPPTPRLSRSHPQFTHGSADNTQITPNGTVSL